MQKICSSNPPIANGVCNPNKSSQFETWLEVEEAQQKSYSFSKSKFTEKFMNINQSVKVT